MTKFLIEAPVAEVIFDYDGVIIAEQATSKVDVVKLMKLGKKPKVVPKFINLEKLAEVLKSAYENSVNVRIVTSRLSSSLDQIQAIMAKAAKMAGFEESFPAHLIHCVGDDLLKPIPLKKQAQLNAICNEHKWDEAERKLRCYFTDDDEQNINAAKECGIQTFLAKTSHPKLPKDLTEAEKLIAEESEHFSNALRFIATHRKQPKAQSDVSLAEHRNAVFADKATATTKVDDVYVAKASPQLT